MTSYQLKTQTIYCGDNLKMLTDIPDESIDLCYIDPPFNSNRNYEVFWGDVQEKRAFNDRFGDADAYIKYMRPRVQEIYRVLKKTGSFYYHCDWHASHYVKIMLDQIFSFNNFRNEIIWKRASTVKGNFGQGSKLWSPNIDNIFFYTKSDDYTFNPLFNVYSSEYLAKFYKFRESDGRRYRLISMIGPGGASKGNPYYEVLGISKYWRYSKDKMKKLIEDGLVVQTKPGTVPQRKQYLENGKGVAIQTLWDDIESLSPSAKERLGYPTQKPIALMERIINASSKKGDVVLDAFCGCGTTLVAAERLNRKWVGIDISPTSCRVMSQRLYDLFKLREGKDFCVDDLPKTEEELRQLPHFEFQNWAVIALGQLTNMSGIPNKIKSGDFGIDGRLYPVELEKIKKEGKDLFGDTDKYYPVQVKQMDKVGRPDIDNFYAAIKRDGRTKGYFVSFAFSKDAETEIRRLWKEGEIDINLITVSSLLKSEAYKK